MQLLTPNTLIQNRYQIIQLVGQGGMGAVYQATDQRLKIAVALKQTLTGDAHFNAAFEREAQLLAALRHPALPRVMDHFADADGQFLVMEFVPGDDLAALLAQHAGPFPVNRVLGWAEQLLRVLEYLHGRQPPLIHRDIKPQNLKLSAEGELMLLDFGLAKGAAAQTRVGGARSMFGYTPQYAPLEQMQGASADPRSDLYATAGTLHHLLTGDSPGDSLTRAAAVLTNQPDPLRPAHELNPQVPADLGALLIQALALAPDARPQSAAAMRAELAAIGCGPAARSTPSVAAPAPARPAPAALPPAAVGATVVVAATPASAPVAATSATVVLSPARSAAVYANTAAAPVAETAVAQPDAPADGGEWAASPVVAAAPQSQKPAYTASPAKQASRMGFPVVVALIIFILPIVLAITAGVNRGTVAPAEPVPTSAPAEPAPTVAPVVSAPIAASAVPVFTAAPAALEPTATLDIRPALVGVVVPQPVSAISPENAEQVIELARWGREGAAEQAAWSPDGKLLAVASSLGVYLYDLDTLAQIRFIEIDAWVTSVVFAPDGQTLASGSGDSTIRLWRVSDGMLMHTLEGHAYGVESVAFTPDGQIIASGSADNSIKLWQASDGALLRTLKGHTDGVNSVAFTLDGQTLASGSFDNRIKLWWVSDGTLLRTLEGHTGRVQFASDGQILASGSAGNSIKLWRVSDSAVLRTLEGHTDGVTSVAYASDGQTLASGSNDGTIKLWRVSDGTLLHTLEGHTDWVMSVTFAPDGQTLASSSHDGTTRLWGVPTPASAP